MANGFRYACLVMSLLFNNIGLFADQADKLLAKVQYYQFSNIDSCEVNLNKLYAVLKKVDSFDLTGKYNLYKGIQLTMTGQIDSAKYRLHKAYYLLHQSGDSLNIIEALLQLGELNYNQAVYDSAWFYFEKAYSLSLIVSDDYYRALTLNYIGKYFHSVGAYNQSIMFYDSAYRMALRLRDKELIVEVQNKIGKHYETMGIFPKALQFYLKSELLLSEINNRIEKATTYNHLGNIYHQLKEYKKAATFHQRAYFERSEMHYQEGVAKSLNNMGEVMVDIHLLDSALSCFKQSYDICADIRYIKGLIKSTQNLGEVYNKLKNYPQAITCYNEALSKSVEISYDKGIVKALIELANLYYRIGTYDKSFELAQQGLGHSIEKELTTSIRDFYKLLSDLYEVTGDTDKALEYFKRYNHYQSTIVNLETNRRIAELESSYNLSEKQRENEKLKSENEIKQLKINRKNQLVLFSAALIATLLLLVVIIYSRYLTKMRANKRLSLLNDEITDQNEKLDHLNQQLNQSVKQQIKLFSIIGHELRNPLWWFRNLIQMLSSQIEEIDMQMVKRSLQSLNESATHTYHLMDNLMQWSKSQLGNYKIQPEPISIKQLVNESLGIFQQYCEAKNIAIENELPVTDLVCIADKQMIKTVVRNLLSNAVKFTPEMGKINISCKTGANQVHVDICNTSTHVNTELIRNVFNQDNKMAFVNESQNAGSGLGLILCNEFIKANQGNILADVIEQERVVFSFSLPLFIQVG